MSIHQRIKERRIALGYSSHEAFGKVVDVAWQTVQAWEKEGGTAPNRNRIGKVAEALQVTPEWLLYGSDEERKDPEGYSPNVAPPWCDPEAFRLLEFYYRCDPRKRGQIMGVAEDLASSIQTSETRDQQKF